MLGYLARCELPVLGEDFAWSASSLSQENNATPVNEDCFNYCSERNNVVVLFGTLKVQSFILTEVSDCGLLIVVTSTTFLKRKDMLKEKSS